MGFHAQQAVEKALKALLTAFGVHHGRTHSLEVLLTLLSTTQVEASDWLSETTVFGPYAVIGNTLEWAAARLSEIGPG